jgi:hypothetical protein
LKGGSTLVKVRQGEDALPRGEIDGRIRCGVEETGNFFGDGREFGREDLEEGVEVLDEGCAARGAPNEEESLGNGLGAVEDAIGEEDLECNEVNDVEGRV